MGGYVSEINDQYLMWANVEKSFTPILFLGPDSEIVCN